MLTRAPWRGWTPRSGRRIPVGQISARKRLPWPNEERLTVRFYVGGAVLIALVFVDDALKGRGASA